MCKSKKTLGFLCACGLLCLTAAGCSDKEETREMDFSLSRYTVVFSMEGGTATVSVGTSYSWSATTESSWLTLSEDESTLVISAAANDETTDIRSAEILVTCEKSGTQTIQVRQEPASPLSLNVSAGSASHVIDSEGGTYTVSVDCNYDWTATLDKDIDGWKLDISQTSGRVTVIAEANAGDPIDGTIVITAGSGTLSASEEIALTQQSRAENPYFQFEGYWLVNAADGYYYPDWTGLQGTYASCRLEGYDYPTEMNMLDWSFKGLELDRLQCDTQTRTVAVRLGYLGGTITTTDGYSLYMYFSTFKEDFTGFSTVGEIIFNLSEDGDEITVSGIPDDYPVIGWLGYRPATDQYMVIGNTTYCKAPITLVKSEETESSASGVPQTSIFGSGISSIDPSGELPEGVPAHLPKEFTGIVSTQIAF